METQRFVRRCHEPILDLPDRTHAGLHAGGIEPAGELEVVLEVARFGGQQPRVEAAKLRVEARCEQGEALAGTRLDEGADDQAIDQPAWLVAAHGGRQARGVA